MRHIMRTHNPTWFALSAIALAISTQTLAEEQQANTAKPQNELEKIIVTGVPQRRTVMASSVSVSSISAEQINVSTPRTTAEAFRILPGVRSESTGGEGNANIAVRGLPVASGGAKFLQLQEDGLPVLQFGDIAFGNAALRNVTNGTANIAIGQSAGSRLAEGSNNLFIGNAACSNNNYRNTSNNLCIGMGTNNLITGNFNTGVVILGSPTGYAYVKGDLYVGGQIYEGQSPSDSTVADNSSNNPSENSDAGNSDGASTASASKSNNKTKYAANDDVRTSGATEPGVDEGDVDGRRRDRSEDEIRSEIDKYARLNDKLNSKETTFNSLTNDINANAEAISSLQTYVANMHQDMNAGFAMNAALSAKSFPAIKGWSFSAGAGFYEDQEALSIGLNYMGEKYGMTFNLAQSQRGGTMANVGVSVSLNGLFQTKKLED